MRNWAMAETVCALLDEPLSQQLRRSLAIDPNVSKHILRARTVRLSAQRVAV